MTSAEILIKISHLKDEVDSKTKEMESLKEELKRINRKEAMKAMLEGNKRADRMAKFIKHNSNRTIIAEYTVPKLTEEGDYIGEETIRRILKPNEYKLIKSNGGNWVIGKERAFSCLLECLDNIYVKFD